MAEVNWNALYGFWLVAECGSFAEAARRLPRGSVQSLHKRVREMERKENLNLKLFRSRGVKGVELTEAGRHIHDLVDPIFRSFNLVAAELRGEESGPLSIALTRYASYNYGLKILEGIARQYPRVSITVLEHQSVEVASLVEAGRVDFGIASPPLRKLRGVQFTGRTPINFELLIPKGHPLRRQSITWKNIVQQPLVLLDRGAVIRQAFENLLRKGRLYGQLRIAVEVSTEELAVTAVKARLGPALVPVGPRLASKLSGVMRITPPPGLPRVDIAIMYREDLYLPRYMRTFLELSTHVIAGQAEHRSD